jgi:hypothetical protein
MLPSLVSPPNTQKQHENEGYFRGEGGHTDGEALDGFVFGGAAGTVGAADGLDVATAMFIAAVISLLVSSTSPQQASFRAVACTSF